MKTNSVKIIIASMLFIMAILVNSNLVIAQQENRKNNQHRDQDIAYRNQLEMQQTDLELQQNHLEVQQKQHGDQRKNMEAQRIAFITKELNLTPDEAKAFWPVYNEYDAKRHEMKKYFKHPDDQNKAEIEKLTEKEASQILDNQIIEAQKLLDLRKEYHTKFKTVLPAVKVLKLYDAEREFQKMLIDKLRQNHSKPPMNKK